MKPAVPTTSCQKIIFWLVCSLIAVCIIAGIVLLAASNHGHVPDDAGFHLYVDYSAYASHPDGFEIVTDIGVYLNAELSQKLSSKCVDPNPYRRCYFVSFSETADPTDTYYICAPTLRLGDLTITPTDLPIRSSSNDDKIELILVKRSE